MRKQPICLMLSIIFSLVMSACQLIRPVTDSERVSGTVAVAPVDVVEQVATLQPSDPLPFDTAVRTGKLANGLTYFIRQNAEPQNRADLWLAINAGSVLEDEDQRGLAHLVEHLLFNGTKRFPEDALVDFLESIGMQFGADLNAYTSFDETVYMLQVPTDNQENLGKALDVLEDWAGSALLDPQQIDAERGVVIEEWRLRDQGANGRITNQWFPLLLAGSQYADRLPIGDVEIIKNASPETIRRFYASWYRPDLMAVVAVGDFDPAQMEAMIQEHFNRLPTPSEPIARPTFPVPFGTENRYKVISDPEFPYAFIDLSYRKPYTALLTVADYQDKLQQELADQMLNARFDEIAHQSAAPFLGASSYAGGLVRPVALNGVQAQTEDDKITQGLAAILTELERVRQHGFTATELDRAKGDLLRRYEAAYAERAKSDSSSYADEYLNYFLTGEATPGIAFEYALVQHWLPPISLAEVNEQTTSLLEQSGRDVLVIAPAKADLTLPTEEELAAVLEETLAQQVDPYVDQAAGAVLLADLPEPAAIAGETTDATLGTTTLQFANGIEVILKPTDFKDDEVLFDATSPGGSSLVEEGDALEADNISQIISNSGVGDLDYNALTRLLSGKRAGVSSSINLLSEAMSGYASPKDLETLFQLIYLYATQPRADPSAFDAFMTQKRTELENRQLDPLSHLFDAYTQARFGDSSRFNEVTLEELETFDLARGLAIYGDRFADMNDFTFIFVGSFDVDAIKPLVQRYIGTLPGADRSETWLDVVPNPPDTVIEETVYKGQDEQSFTLLEFNGIVTATAENRLHLQLLQNVVDLRMTDELRERLGGTYGASVFSNLDKYPDSAYSFGIWYGADPKRVEELSQATWENLDKIEAEGPSEEEFAKTIEQAHRQHEKALRENQYWLDQLSYSVQNPDEDAHAILTYDDQVNAVTPAAIQAAAQLFLNEMQVIKLMLLPEAYQP